MDPHTGRYRDFITAWYESSTLEEVCRRLGLDRRAASNIAGHLRREGIPLPARRTRGTPPPDRRRIDWPALKQWAAICAGRAEAERYRRGA